MLDESFFRGRRLAIVGNICRDVKMGAIRPGRHLLEDGETPTAFIAETIGGGGANSALAAAALGADVRLGGKVGADSLGQRLEQSLARRGVTTFIRRDPQVATGNSIVLSYESGCRHFVSCQPNNDSLAMADIDPAMLSGAQHLLRADVWFSEPMLAGGNEELFRAARARSLATSLDINWDPHWGSADAATMVRRKESVRRILPWVDLVHGNVRELSQFADSNDWDATLEQITAWGAGAIVIHLGADGAGYYDRGQLTVAPAIPVRQYKNTAGTGDLLSVCMMLLHGRDEIPLGDRLRLANTIVAEFIEGKRGVIPELE
jgi:sugar/nucleoside kinase (ribokinase family)